MTTDQATKPNNTWSRLSDVFVYKGIPIPKFNRIEFCVSMSVASALGATNPNEMDGQNVSAPLSTKHV